MKGCDENKETLESGFGSDNLIPLCSRRQVLKWGSLSMIGLTVLRPSLAQGAVNTLVVMDQAKGLVVADPMKCVGCGRCELACTEFNFGKASPTLARIKISRNLNYGPYNVLPWREGKGNWGDGIIVQDFCKQCPHPVPCANSCPENAIVVSPATQARMIDPAKCNGCRLCLKACPWEMISFDDETLKATKCNLCDGKPKCVEACPAQALSFVSWRDLTHQIPPRITNMAMLSSDRTAVCEQCHMPGQAMTLREGINLLRSGGRRDGKPVSAREVGYKWIDLGGSILVPLAVVGALAHAAVRKVRET
jgi:Fe-S-cluster-containing dehydrogenase component